MLNVRFICHGTLKEDYLRMACAEYMKRLGGYCRPEILEAKDDKALAALIREKDYTIALCVEGKELSSPSLPSSSTPCPKEDFPPFPSSSEAPTDFPNPQRHSATTVCPFQG